jgi:hypothetical protein
LSDRRIVVRRIVTCLVRRSSEGDQWRRSPPIGDWRKTTPPEAIESKHPRSYTLKCIAQLAAHALRSSKDADRSRSCLFPSRNARSSGVQSRGNAGALCAFAFRSATASLPSRH